MASAFLEKYASITAVDLIQWKKLNFRNFYESRKPDLKLFNSLPFYLNNYSMFCSTHPWSIHLLSFITYLWSFQDQMASKKIHIFDKNLFKILCKIVAQLMTTMQESNKKSKIMQQLCKNVAWFLNIIFENHVKFPRPDGKQKDSYFW